MSGRSGIAVFVAAWPAVVLAAVASSLASGNGETQPRTAPAQVTLAKPSPPSESEPSFQRRPVVPPGFPGQPPPRGTVTLPQMVHIAGMIFSGKVLWVVREPTSEGFSLHTIAITFHVDHGFQGVTTGKDLTIHEWEGAWSSGQHYRAGERVLLFLYPPSKLGLTSCVAGPVGRLHFDGLGRVVLSTQHLAAFAGDPVLGGKSRVILDDFAQAVRKARGGE
jgi:hypothetical protein